MLYYRKVILMIRNDKANTDKEKVVLMRKVIMIVVIRIIPNDRGMVVVMRKVIMMIMRILTKGKCWY